MPRWLERFIPHREQIQSSRWLRWLAPYLLNPRLWHINRRSVAMGVSVGVFFGLLVPLAQIPLAAGAAIVLRANVPIAIGSTLVTNPVTFAPIYVFAHRLGSAVLDTERDLADIQPLPLPEPVDVAPLRWWQSIGNSVLNIGKPLLVGLVILAVSGAVLLYAAIMLFWRIRIGLSWQRRQRQRKARQQ